MTRIPIADGADGLAWLLKQTANVPEPVREYVFHPTRKWRFDLAWPDRLIAVEVDGGIYINGGHNRGKHIESDAEKVSEAAALGWRVLRVTQEMVDDQRAVDLIKRALAWTPEVRVLKSYYPWSRADCEDFGIPIDPDQHTVLVESTAYGATRVEPQPAWTRSPSPRAEVRK